MSAYVGSDNVAGEYAAETEGSRTLRGECHRHRSRANGGVDGVIGRRGKRKVTRGGDAG